MSKNIEFISVSKDDLEQIRGWRNSKEVSDYMYTDTTITSEEQIKWYNRHVLNNPHQIYWIICYNDQKVGLVSINNIDYTNKKCSWAFYIGETGLKGGGIGSLVEYKVIEYVFTTLKMNKLCCEVLAFNKAVIKLHGKFGFKEEGVLHKHIFKAGEFLDVHVFALFPDVWEVKKENIERILKINV